MSIVFEKPHALSDVGFHYCPGCTHGIVHRLVAEVLDELKLEVPKKDYFVFEKGLVFVDEVEKRLKKDIKQEEYQIYIDRFWQAMCRVLCSQEIMHAVDNNIKYSDLKERLKMICTHSLTLKSLKKYPIWKLPLKQGVFAFGVKHRLYFLLKLLVGFRR